MPSKIAIARSSHPLVDAIFRFFRNLASARISHKRRAKKGEDAVSFLTSFHFSVVKKGELAESKA
jgi:hypothetical protein